MSKATEILKQYCKYRYRNTVNGCSCKVCGRYLKNCVLVIEKGLCLLQKKGKNHEYNKRGNVRPDTKRDRRE